LNSPAKGPQMNVNLIFGMAVLVSSSSSMPEILPQVVHNCSHTSYMQVKIQDDNVLEGTFILVCLDYKGLQPGMAAQPVTFILHAG
jgi:hypothetical protein